MDAATLTVQAHAIVIEDVRKQYGQIAALRGISMTVRRGEIFGLLGANGAGKTTLLRTLIGSTRPSGGRVQVLGYDPLSQPRALRQLIGYMPQSPALYEDLSPRENVRFFGRAHEITELERRIDEVLEFTSLRSRERDPVYGFSGGMKQRVSLACALVHQPQLLLLDEPTAGVDPRLREAFWQHFRQLAASGVTLLVSTHQLDEALHCDRVAIMRDGLLLAADTPRNLLRQGQARVSIQRGAELERLMLHDYQHELPRLLQRYDLDPAITRIEVEEDTLETIVLRLISARELPSEPIKEKPYVSHT